MSTSGAMEATTPDVPGPPPMPTDGLRSVLQRVACPGCGGGLAEADGRLACGACEATYANYREYLDLRPPVAEPRRFMEGWDDHWKAGLTLPERCFSVYRKTVCAAIVGRYANRYFADEGVLVEAGCGTAESSLAIRKHGGRRTLVGLDLVPGVFARCHPVIDVRMTGDIFRMPFADASVDGIWNVGVMEHFTHEEIDEILQEFRRVLRPGARLILYWPGTSSLPQKLLNLVAGLVSRVRGQSFRFHPEEISQLRSRRQGVEIVERNGFRAIGVFSGLGGAIAFKTVVAERV